MSTSAPSSSSTMAIAVELRDVMVALRQSRAQLAVSAACLSHVRKVSLERERRRRRFS